MMMQNLTQAADTLQQNMQAVNDTAGLANSFYELSFRFSNIWEIDCNGNGNSIAIAIMGMTIVFSSLVLIYLFVNNISRLFMSRAHKKASESSPGVTREEMQMSGEVNAAIAAALYLHFSEVHDFENTVLTIKKVSKTYSPWSSKIYNLRQHPRNWHN